MIDPAVEREIEAVRANRTEGASWLARRSLEVVGEAAALSRGERAADVLAELGEIARRLAAARPGMAPVRSWLDRLLAALAAEAERSPDADELRRRARATAREMVRRAEASGSLAARNAADRMSPGERVFTASFSATAAEACRLAFAAGRLTQVLAAESRTAEGRAYGEDVVRALAPAGVPVAVVPDADLDAQVSRASLVLIGADSVLRDGSVLNGTPSLALARAGRDAGFRLWVVCESAKLDRWSDPAALDLPPGFDRLPAELVDAVIAEDGPATPSERASGSPSGHG